MTARAHTPRSLSAHLNRGIAAAACLLVGATSALTVAAQPASAVTGFTAGDVVVYTVGTAGASGSTAAVSLNEYTPAGTLVQSVPLPTTASGSNKPLTASNSGSSEGLLTLSPNSQYLVATGYDTGTGTASISGTSSTTVPRTVAVVNAAGTIDTSTALTDAATGNNFRSAVTDNGTNLWVTGAAGGVRYTTTGSSTSTELVNDSSYKNQRQLEIYNGQLYTSADPTKNTAVTIATVGTGLPKTGTSSAVTNLPFSAAPAEPYAYSFATLGTGTAPDTIYAADNSAGAVVKYSLSGGSWVKTGQVSVPSVTGVTADDVNGTVSIFATATSGTNGTLYSFSDSSGMGGTLSGSATTRVTASASQTFRGVAFTPGTVFGTGGTPPPPAPTITPAYTGLPATIGDPTNATLPITVADTGVDPSQITLTAASGTTSVAPQSGISISGTGGTRTLTVTPGSTGGYSTITLSASAPGSGTTTTTITYGLSADLGDSSDRYFSGAGNGSTAIDVGGGYMVVGDDENNILRLYNETESGPPVKTFDFTGQLPFGTTEVDIEASARSGNTLYWLGSMSNSSSGKLEPARSTLFAATIAGSGANTSLTYLGAYTGLQTDLINWDKNNGHGLGANYLGLDQSVNGDTINHAIDSLEVEGMEFAHGSSSTAYLAFRGPIEPASNRQDALVVPLTNIDQLVTGGATQATFGAPLLWNLGGLGIREIRANSDGSYLLIAGTADGTNSSFVLYSWDGNVNDLPLQTNTTLPLTPPGTNQGSWESIVSVPDPLTSGTSVQLLEDNGDTAWYGDGATSKDTLQADLQKDLGRVFTYTPATPNSVVITADNQSRAYGAADPTFTFMTSGLSGSDTLTAPPTCGVSGDDTAVGTYSIVCSGAATSGQNDAISYVAGTLTVTQSAASVSVSVDPDAPVAHQPVTFTATVAAPAGSTGSAPTGTVEFSIGGTDIAGCSTVNLASDNTAVCVDSPGLPAGSESITAAYSGDTNFAPSSQALTVTVGSSTYVFVDENPNGPNEVSNYRVNPDGGTTLIGSYPTGHPGSDASWVSAERTAYAPSTGYLYALNLGDFSVSVFSVAPDTGALTLEETTSSLDATTIAVNPAGTVLYAGGATNAGTDNQLSTYAIGADGSINAMPIASVITNIDGIAVSPDGTELATAYPSAGPEQPNVSVYTTDGQGDLTAEASSDQPCPTDVRFISDTTLVSTACYQGSVTSYALDAGQLTATGTTAGTSQPLDVASDGSVLFTTSDGLQAAAAGAGSLTTGPAASYTVDSYHTPTSITTTPDGGRAFVADFTNGTTPTIADYSVGAGHQLTANDSISLPVSLPSIVAYATFAGSGASGSTTSSEGSTLRTAELPAVKPKARRRNQHLARKHRLVRAA